MRPLSTRAPERATAPRSGVGFATALADHGDRPALVCGATTVSYGDLAGLVADARTRLGTEQQLVGLTPAPTLEFVVAYLAALADGHSVLLARDEVLPRAYGASRTWSDGGYAPTRRPAPELHPDLRLLLSTSGSTGSPKLVRLSQANLESNAAAIADYLGLTPDDRALMTLPLDYCYGLSVLHSHLSVGASVVLTDASVTDPALWDLARTTGVTSYAGVPFTFELLDAAGWPQVPTLRQVTQAGGRLAPERVRAAAERGAREGWDLVVMYGQTEATARMAYLPPALATTAPASIGVAIPGGDLRLAPVDGHPVGVGELVYTGPNVMMGYAHGVADLARGAELDELRTGDLARITDAGLFEIVGRTSRFAKLFGQRIDLDRLETLLTLGDHQVACAESVDATRLVVALAGPVDPIAVEEVETTAAAATGLPPHAITVCPVTELPRLANGKVDQRSVARLESRPAATPTLSATDSLTALYGAVLRRRHVSPDDTFAALGGDSLSYVELAMRLESRLGRLPADWPDRPIAELAALSRLATGARRSWWARVDTSIVLRAVAIVMIVGSHTNLFVLLGGAHVLLGVAGANFARFHLASPDSAERARNLARSIARIAVPTSLWVAAVCVVSGQYGWRNVLLLNDALGSHRWQEPQWHFWFIEVLVYLMVAAGALTSIPLVAAWERRTPYWFAIGLVFATLVPRFWATATGYDGDVFHSSTYVAWFFAAGWAATRAQHVGHRLLLSALLVVGVHGLFDDPMRETTIVIGLLALVLVRSVPLPRVTIGLVSTIASASLYVYLTHWQVYPHLEDRWPLGGLLASLVIGIAAWRLVDLVSGLGHRRPRRPSAQYSPNDDTIKEPR
ncbi:AMP-binding protein [Nocardioides humilatus]|uniref:AMP-binding protein n=1 Tax=Nocardioides humilatus TaxID=2607660 RepID=A0A5B1LFL1_9ACTN|nr:AMP-binding protein [Nocardioides humilatus]KAA1419462.1 AMP-binding protein [Nocardioides humilatus]